MKYAIFVFRPLLWRAVNWLLRIYNDKLTPPWVLSSPYFIYGASCAMLNIDWTSLFLQQTIFWGLLTLFSTSDWISTRVLDACMQLRFRSLRKHETVSFADSSGPDPGGAGGRASPLSPSETCHHSDQYVQPAMGFPDFSFRLEFSQCLFFWAHLQLLLLR